MRGFITTGVILALTALTGLGLYGVYHNRQDAQGVSLSGDPFIFTSAQVGSTPTNTYILQTDGTDSTWVDPTTLPSSDAIATSTALADTQVIYGTGVATIGSEAAFTYDDATNLLTTEGLAVSGVGTTTFGGAINLTSGSSHVTAHGIRSDASDGLHIHANNWTEVANFGVGNTANASLYGALNIGTNLTVSGLTSGRVPYLTTGGLFTDNSNFTYNGSVLNYGDGTATSTVSGNQRITGNLQVDLATILGAVLYASGDIALSANTSINWDSGDILLTHSANKLDLTGGDFAFNTNDLFVDSSSSNVGIGTTTPTGRLHVYNPVATNFVMERDATNEWRFLLSNGSLQIQDGISSQIRMVIDSNGDVGIGDTSPASALTVGNGDLFQVTSSGIITAIAGLSGATGTYDFGGVTSFELPNGTAPAVDAIGEFAFDTTDNQLLIATSTNATYPAVIRTDKQRLFAFTLASTSPEFISGGVIPIPSERDGYTIKEFSCYVDGGTSVVVNVSDGTNDTETITCATTVTTDTDVSNNNIATAGEKMEIQIGTITGTPDYLTFSAFGAFTRE